MNVEESSEESEDNFSDIDGHQSGEESS